jgi:serine/threonine protein kinase
MSRFVLANGGRTIYAEMSADGSEMKVFVRDRSKAGVKDKMKAQRETGTHLLEALDLLPWVSGFVGAQGGARLKSKIAVMREHRERFLCRDGKYEFRKRIGPPDKPISLARDHAGNDVVVKALPNDQEGRNEIDINRQLRALNDPHLLNCLDVGMKKGELLLVSEFAQYGVVSELREKISALQRIPYKRLHTTLRPILRNVDSILLLMLQDVLKGLAAMHNIGVIHRDLRLENVFVCAEGVGKVGDFGTAMKEGVVSERSLQSPRNLAPEHNTGNLALANSLGDREKYRVQLQAFVKSGELTLDDAKSRLAAFDSVRLREYCLTPAADMYAFGLLAHKLLHGEDLLEGDELAARENAILLAYRHVKTPANTSVNPRLRASIETLVNACKQRTVGKRPTAETLLENKLFDEFREDKREREVRLMVVTLLEADLDWGIATVDA